MQFAYQLCIALYALLFMAQTLEFSAIIYYESSSLFYLKKKHKYLWHMPFK